jgi:hypothetical protein
MKHLLTPSRAVGVCFARQHISVVQLRRSAARWQLETFVERKLSAPWFDSVAMPAATENLRQALAELTASFASTYIPVHVALPDPAVRVAIFELEELPKSPAAQTSLVEFRFNREPAAAGALVSVSQALGQVRSQLQGRAPLTQLLFGMSIDSGWHEAVQSLLREVGVVAWGIAPGALQRFNLLHDKLAEGSGALVSVSADSWALLLWDEQGRLRHCNAHWRDPAHASADGDHQSIATETARVIVAYVDAHPERSIQKIFVAGGIETEAIAATLDRRASAPCNKISLFDLIDGCDERLRASRSGEAALSAALSL